MNLLIAEQFTVWGTRIASHVRSRYDPPPCPNNLLFEAQELLPTFMRGRHDPPHCQTIYCLRRKNFSHLRQVWGARIASYLRSGQIWPSSLPNNLLFEAWELLPTFIRSRHDPPHCWIIYCLRRKNCFLPSSWADMTLLISKHFAVWGARIASYLCQGQVWPSSLPNNPNNLLFQVLELLPTFVRGRYDLPHCQTMYCLRRLLPAFVRADMTLLIAKQFTVWDTKIASYLCQGQIWPSSLLNNLLFEAQELLPTFGRCRYDLPHCWTIYCLRHKNCFLPSSGADRTLLVAKLFTVWGARIDSYLQ
jgi:hypothetical protein